jgi:hypothetical protein
VIHSIYIIKEAYVMEEGGMVTDGLEMRLAKGKRKREKQDRQGGVPTPNIPTSNESIHTYTRVIQRH